MDSEESAALQAVKAFESTHMVGADRRAEEVTLRCVDARCSALLVLRGLPGDPTIEQLERELRAELGDFTDLTVELDFYENAQLLLCEPRQRTKLVRYVIEQARRLLVSDDDEMSIDWRSASVLVAIKSICLRRSVGRRVARVDAEQGRAARVGEAAECGRVHELSLDGMHVLLVNRCGFVEGACVRGDVD